MRNTQKRHHNRTEVKAVKRDVSDSMDTITKIIYSTFGLVQGENVGSMSSPTIQDVQSLLEEVENLSSYYRALTS